MVLLLFSVLFRVFYIQNSQGEKYRKLATDLTVKQDTVYANKGNVYAADGNLLATSMSRFTIRMDVMSVEASVFQSDVSKLSKELSELLGKPAHHYKKKMQNARKIGNRYLLIARDVSYNDYVKIKSFPIFNLGVYKGGFIAEQKTVRAHPIGKIAERTIGYSDYRGGAGIEGAYADFMAGENGLRWKQRIAKGQWKPISDVNEKEPVDGRDVVTTIDVNMQDITHHALLKQLEYFEADHGCAVVMEVKTGEIKAIANLGRTKNGKYYEKRNYAVWESHEPGSTFKLASLMAAIDDKVIDTSTVVDAEKGKIFIHGRKVEDSERGGHGEISAARVFEVSSNVGIVKLIRKHYDDKPEKFIERLDQYHLTKPLGLVIKGEGKPVVPKPNDKNWYKTTLEWMSWGYGVAVTPLQMLTLYNAVANDGVMVKPRFIKEIKRQNKIEKTFETEILNLEIASKETIKKMKKVMENVVIKGTADNIYTPNFSMAGKTGTAKKFVPTHVNSQGDTIYAGYSDDRYVASFAGFFPVDKPKYSCIVVIHDPDKKKGYYGAIVAAPVFKEIAQKIYTSSPKDSEEIKEVQSFQEVDETYLAYQEKAEKISNKIPDVVGMPAMDAISLLENLGLKVKVKGFGNVKNQSLEEGLEIAKGQTILLTLAS